MKVEAIAPACRRRTRDLQSGVALPVALILLAILTGLVLMQVRRGMADERLAGNARQTVAIESAAETVLRLCEKRIELNLATSEPPADPPPGDGTAAWRDPARWSPARTFRVPDLAIPDVVFHACLIEDARAELDLPLSPTGAIDDALDPGWRKFRITAQVQMRDPSMPLLLRSFFVQSEILLYL